MKKFLARRILLAIGQLLIVATILFFSLRFMEGDPVLLSLGSEKVDPEAVERVRTQLGLDLPLGEQYVKWLGQVVRWNFGDSISYSSSVSEFIAARFPRTLELAVCSIVLAAILGVLIGLAAAITRGGFLDMLVTSTASLGISLPVYVLGTFMIVLFSLKLGWLPSSGYAEIFKDPGEHVRRLILPAVTLALGLAASIARMTRSSMLEVLSKDFVHTLRAKGLPERTVIFKHVFRNALVPIVTIIGLQLGNLIGGMVLIEYLFNWPGISSLLVHGINYRDYPLIQGSTMTIAAFFILINLLVDVLYGLLDPRVRNRR